MRRIVNILAKMVSAIVLALIFLPLLVALLFEIPAVQNFVAREATEITSASSAPASVSSGGYRLVLPRFARRILCRGFPTGYVALCRPSGCPDQEPRPVRGRARFQPGRIVGRPFLPARNSRRGDEHQAGGSINSPKRTRPGRRENSGWRSSVWKRMGWISAWNGWSTAIRRTEWILPICT